MATGGLTRDEVLEQFRWLVKCGLVDLVEISRGNAEKAMSKMHSMALACSAIQFRDAYWQQIHLTRGQYRGCPQGEKERVSVKLF